MNWDETILDRSEKLIFALRALYRGFGYSRYRMGKFEEYDLYRENKDFLISDNVITFTDTDGKLMALKPDVTLSVIKNRRDEPDALLKLCYNENVYRVSGRDGGFREIMQAGVECIGRVDDACLGEMLLLAAKSLALCASDFVLEVSQLDILTAFVGAISDDAETRRAVLKCVGEKNAHGAAAIAREAGAAEEAIDALLALMGLYGAPKTCLPKLRALCAGRGLDAATASLETALSALAGSGLEERVLLDFSPVSDLHYYNGILFQGFVKGIPERVLSGGQYDMLMRQMGKKSR
ncbi:MAG: ATP phosphoribosyltransferase regulatory subunit, partial [Oscillibacter sp.]|nr:ATP phosphoribosyltransferase regulatory subunit [Oscillibacter sp.]